MLSVTLLAIIITYNCYPLQRIWTLTLHPFSKGFCTMNFHDLLWLYRVITHVHGLKRIQNAPILVFECIHPYRRLNLPVKLNKINGYATWRIQYSPKPYVTWIHIGKVSDTSSIRYIEYRDNIVKKKELCYKYNYIRCYLT